MQKDLTELVFILDRSGSMSGLERDTIGGFNSILEKHNSTDGECIVTTVLFDGEYELLHERLDILNIKPITEDEYFVRGSTALLDAIGKTINKIGIELNNLLDEQRPEHVMFVIITDGEENASKEFTRDQIKQMVEHQTEVYKWEFIFLGANIDAFSVANSIGVQRSKTANYYADSEGTEKNFEVIHNLKSMMMKKEYTDEKAERLMREIESETDKKKKK
jgi:uncharacterized protein YegL